MADPGPGVIRAAGALLWRDGPEVALIHRPRYDDWSFPKGKADRGEHPLRAAVRETEEETGIVPRLGRRLPTITYPVGDRVKEVDYWAARPAAESAFTPNDEVDDVIWLPADEAEAKLSYRHDADLLRGFLSGPARTSPLVILRHASAGRSTRGGTPTSCARWTRRAARRRPPSPPCCTPTGPCGWSARPRRAAWRPCCPTRAWPARPS